MSIGCGLQVFSRPRVRLTSWGYLWAWVPNSASARRGDATVSPAADADTVTFLHVLAATDAIVTTPPSVGLESSAQTARVSVLLQDQAVTIDFSLDASRGKVTIRNRITDSVLLEKELETVVKP